MGGALTGSPEWSPDGRRIVYDSRPEGPADIYVVDTATGASKQITTNPRRMSFRVGQGRRSNLFQLEPQWFLADLENACGRRDGRPAYERRWICACRILRRRVRLLRERPNGGRALAYSGEGGAEEHVLSRLKPGYWGYWALCNGSLFFAERSRRAPAPLYSSTMWGRRN